MTVTIIATAGATDANSYLTVADGDAIADTMLSTRGWSTATTNEKGQALIQATRYLDQLDWVGDKASTTQALLWPRTDAECGEKSYASTVIPDEVELACFDLADALLETPTLITADPAARGELIPGIPNADLRSAQVDVLRVEFKETGTGYPSQKNALTVLPHLVGVLGCLCLSGPTSSSGRIAVYRS